MNTTQGVWTNRRCKRCEASFAPPFVFGAGSELMPPPEYCDDCAKQVTNWKAEHTLSMKEVVMQLSADEIARRMRRLHKQLKQTETWLYLWMLNAAIGYVWVGVLLWKLYKGDVP